MLPRQETLLTKKLNAKLSAQEDLKPLSTQHLPLQQIRSESRLPSIKSALPILSNYPSPGRIPTRKSARTLSSGPRQPDPTPTPQKLIPPKSSYSNSVKTVAYKTKVGFVCGKPKLHNQDSFIIKPSLKGIRGHYLFAVLDGHGTYGHDVSSFIRENFTKIIEECLESELSNLSIEKNLYQSINKLNKELLDSGIEIAFSGSTFNSIFVLGTLCVCGNVGDSRAVLARFGDCWESIALSHDHNTKRVDERNRILNSNGRIAQNRNNDGEFEGPERVWFMDENYPGLAMTRSIGDKISKAIGVSSDPEVLIRRLVPEDKFIILASDGVWEHTSNEEAVRIVSKYWDENRVEDAALALVSEASKKWNKKDYMDDITVLIIFLNIQT